VTTRRPAEHLRQCSLPLRHSSLTDDDRLVFYVNEDHCIRCDSASQQKVHLCSGCLEYLREEIG
jgi:hypothetical protein